jgi:hypothetical protein
LNATCARAEEPRQRPVHDGDDRQSGDRRQPAQQGDRQQRLSAAACHRQSEHHQGGCPDDDHQRLGHHQDGDQRRLHGRHDDFATTTFAAGSTEALGGTDALITLVAASGGVKGTYITFTDIATNLWLVDGIMAATTAATVVGVWA